MAYLKPQSPIKFQEDHIYPLTTVDQIIMEDGQRLSGVGVYLEKPDENEDTTVEGVNADTLGGIAASDYVLETELDTYKDNVATNYLLKTETAANSNLLGGKSPIYYIQPRNLLDNSDFRNPVNQRGQTSYTGVKYTIDRWRAYHADTTHEITTSGIHVSSTGVNPNLYQHINSAGLDVSKKYTAAACDSDGNVYTWSGLLTNTVGEAPVCVYVTGENSTIRLSKSDTTWVWAALYEGEYTVETLPPYVPKGYGIELAECLRYFRRFGNQQINATIHIGMGMAATTTVANVTLELGIPLRSPTPSISYTGTVYLRYGTTDVAVSALSMNYQSFGQTYFAATSSSLTAGRVYALRLYNGACIDISADL